ncbi:hypothetical protein [Engelhardtia mirabilis]|uniref:Tetratricopeptide repeat protein n=1 Tax=Engelhardtia mirabilis TaxID=2528011 RepID=A0A518BGT2_9BACT|nr:hypothetical protein Pla133_11990 [Planctomycetes bacterium Pla133]QDV00460.1 hypothetical protein Pla86_11990 [Planctomycetes bacterium Pla86]
MKSILSTLLATALAAISICGAPRASTSGVWGEPLDAQVESLLQSALDAGTQADVEDLYVACMVEHGELEPLARRLDELLDGAVEGERRRAALRLDGYLAWRHGELDHALERFEVLVDDENALGLTDNDARFARARLLDAQGRTEAALEAYGELVSELDDPELTTRLLVRMALMSMEQDDEGGRDALSSFAREEGRSVDLVNRAAIVLALLGRPADAIELYVVAGDEKERARGQLRVAEWALRAGDLQRAETAAWEAVDLANVARERRYALTLLTEAHRADGTLEALVARFDAGQDDLSSEAREVWIELLRETGAWDQAIAIVSTEGGAEAFTDDERRSLLEMYREAGREEQMIAAYRERIALDPRSTVWREGLAQTFLERGDRAAAVAVWEDWLGDLGAGSRLLGAQVLRDIGLDDLAERSAESAVEEGDDVHAALLFLFDLHRVGGRLDQARASLERLDAIAAPDAAVRMQLAEAHERLGDKARAVAILGDLVAARPPGEAGEDVEMRLAWLLSEVGEEEQALVAWRELWERVQSVPRRRYVEDRMMTVAARLGSLADIVVELEEKLLEGTASERDSGLLVRIYTKVGDAVSAAEVIEEYMRRSGGAELQSLTEKARVYLSCNDYYHYERAVRRLIEIDPEGEADYLQQLAMSQLERGRPDEARAVLTRLASLDSEASSVEFEAGVLALSGMRAEAIAAYRRGLAAHPERIDGYLLMSGLMKELGQSDLAFGMFQYLAETADGDDLFTIAIDGILNLLVEAPPRPKVLQWARRVTLERLATRHDKAYLYQLLADLAQESGDHEGHLIALENSLASSGPRRGSILRELMDLCAEQVATFGVEGREAQPERHLAYGRRLVGLAEAVPPQVYLDLGAAFLEAQDEDSAARTFDLTRDLPDGVLYQRQAAGRFEEAGYIERSTSTYESVLATQPGDVSLLVKVGELHEQLGEDGEAAKLYGRAMDLLLRRRTLVSGATKKSEAEKDPYAWAPRNLDDFGQHYERVLLGLLSTVEDGGPYLELLAEQVAAFRVELPEALAQRADMDAAAGDEAADGDGQRDMPLLSEFPRLESRAAFHRRAALAAGRLGLADDFDRELVAAFAGDDDLIEALVRERLRWGLGDSARELIEASDRSEEQRRALLVKVGEEFEAEASGPVPVAEASRRILPLVMEGRTDELSTLVRRADLRKVESAELGHLTVLFAAARLLGDDGLLLRIGREWLRAQLSQNRSSYYLESTLDQIGAALNGDSERSLYRYFVSLVLEDVEHNAQLVTLLPKLAGRFDEPIVDQEEVLSLLDGYGERYAWGLGPVLELLPSAERAGALRGIWDRIEKTNRATLLVDLVAEFQSDLGDELGAFATDAFAASLEDAEDYITYSISDMLEVERNREVVLAMAEAFAAEYPTNEAVKAVIVIQEHALGIEGATERAARTWVALGRDESGDYYVNRARTRLAEEFLPEALDVFAAALDGREDEDGASAEVALARIELYQGADEDERADELLGQALEAYPEDLPLLRRQMSRFNGEGRRARALELQERIARLTEGDDDRKQVWVRVADGWAALQQPERELAARLEVEALGGTDENTDNPFGIVIPPGVTYFINGVAYRGGETAKGLPKTIEDVKEALDAGDEQEARVVLRRLWRSFLVGETADRFAFFGRSPMASLSWPHDPKEPDAEEAPSRGGLDAFLESERKALEKEVAEATGETEEQDDPLPTAYEVMAESDVLVSEMERFLRTRQPRELDSLQPLFEGLLAAKCRTVGEDETLAALLVRMRSGAARKGEMIQLLAALDERPDVAAQAGDVVSSLVRTLNPQDVAQVRRLARVLVRAGRAREALGLYRWCAVRADAGGGRMVVIGDDVSSSVSVNELVAEAKELFDGEDRIELIEAALAYAQPGDYPWLRESFELLVLNTWAETVDADQALARTRAICDRARDLSTGLRRTVAVRAAAIYLGAGELEPALEALEVGIAKLDPELVAQPEESWYRTDPEQPGYLSTGDMRRLFPSDLAAVPDALRWLRMCATTLEQWLDEDRVNELPVLQSLYLIALRLDALGQSDEAAALVERLAVREGAPFALELWTIDALRLLGRTDEADTRERRLLEDRRLHVQRIPEVIARILEREGPEAALAAAETIADDTRMPALLDSLLAAAEAAGDEAALARWRGARAAAESAREELEALEDD